MPTKNLSKTNPYLSDPAKRAKALWSSVSSSSAIEGVRVAKDTVTGETAIPAHKPEESGQSPR